MSSWSHHIAALSLLILGCQPTSPGEPLPIGNPAVDPPSPMSSSLRVTAIEPPAWSNQGGIPLEISGQGFAPGAAVTVDGVAAEPVTILSATRLLAQLPARPGAFGPVPLTVTNPDSQSSPPSY